MVAQEHRVGLYISIPVYFCVLGCCAWWAHRRMEKMEHEKVNDKLTAHYLGGRSFGPLLTAGTVFASLFSGYTVIGVPNEAYRTGWKSLRWMATIWGIIFGFFGAGIRLRKSSNIRNHQSPVDFITDRYQSQFLRYMIVFLQVVPAIIYLAAQVRAIKGTFNSMFELDADTNWPVVLIMAIILIFEIVGGLNSVALTDSLQAIVMFFSFVAVPSILASKFYGWKDLDPYTYPKPEFYQTPSKDDQWKFWQFCLINFSFFTLPHFMQRLYAAKDLKSLKAGYATMTIANWFTMPVGCFIGTVGVMILDGDNVLDPFTSVLEALMDEGGFSKVVGIIAVTASLAAIMSTADSLIIAISQLITVEIVYPARPKTTPKQITWIGRFVSLFAVVISSVIGITWKDGISDLGNIQFPLSMQAVPAFILGLYTINHRRDIHPWCIATGALSATAYVFGIYFGYLRNASSPVPIDAGMTGVFLNIIVTILMEALRRIFGISKSSPRSDSGVTAAAGVSCTYEQQADSESQVSRTSQLLFPRRPAWDVPKLTRFGEHSFPPELVWKSMEGVNEPMANPWWAFMMFFAISLITPLVAENQPPLDPATGTFYGFVPPATVNGIPWWAFKILMLSIVPCTLLLIAIWNMPNAFVVDEKKIAKEGIDPDLVELTPQEMGKRDSYDEQNILVSRRRLSISASMKSLGITQEEIKRAEDSAMVESRRQLSALVSARDLFQTNLENVVEDQEEREIEKIVEGEAEEEHTIEDVEKKHEQENVNSSDL
mmetsp:Transcript_11220/g.24297  ORF Transcript_11220/g.24297 Transcript_11220/m.24297 type:complete len:771 (-) Transcript_11220:263-2575(-)